MAFGLKMLPGRQDVPGAAASGVRQKARIVSARKPKNEKDVKTISSSKGGVSMSKKIIK